MKIPFHKPIFPTDVNTVLKDTIDSGWVTTGPKVKEFEKELCNYLQAKNVIAVNSCTAALHLALAAKGIGKEDKFIVPTNTFVASVEVGEYLGAEPVLVDSDPHTFNLDLNQVEEVLNKDKNIKALIPVHFGGQVVDMNVVNQLKNKYGLFVVEDAAHAFESVSAVGKVGNTSDAAAFSFYANKNITTGGEGGALATNDDKLADKVRILSLHGMSKDVWKRLETGGMWAYDVTELGYKYNMTDIAASFGLEQLYHIDDWYKRRKSIVDRYNHGMSDIDGLTLPPLANGNMNAWHLFVVRIKPKLWQVGRDVIIKKISEYGIGTSVHYIPVHMHSHYRKKYGYVPGDFPVAKSLSETVITVPLYPRLSDIEVDYVIDTINMLWEKFRV